MSVKLCRNVMLVGKTGSGKSTVANFIASNDPLHHIFPVTDGQDSNSTYFAQHTEVKYKVCGITYESKIVDTRGLFDTEKETAKSILDNVKKYLTDRVSEGINLLVFVLREGRFTEEEEKVFKIIMDNFEPEISSISALVITHCETLTDKQRKKVVEDFKTKNKTKDIAAFMKKGILDVGFTTHPVLQVALAEQMKTDGMRLRELLFCCEETKLNKTQLEDEGFWARIRKRCIIL